MTNPFVGEIQLFGFPFAPVGWATCSGQIVPLRQNPALYSLLGTNYGGDGVNTFALPNLNGFSAMDQGTGPGLTPRRVGDLVGTTGVTLQNDQMPMHTHAAQIYMARGTAARVNTPQTNCAPSNCTMAQGFTNDATPPDTTFHPMTLSPAGGGQIHPNQQPYLVLNYSIAMQGVFPSFG